MKFSRPSHATVVAYLALFAALGGSAYAVSKIGTSDIRRGAVTSPKIKNGGVESSDVARAAIGVKQLRAQPLVESAEFGECNPTSAAFTDCGGFGIKLEQSGSILVISTGGQHSVGGPASGRCKVQIAGATDNAGSAPGEAVSVNTDSDSTNGFAHVFAFDGLAAGPHNVFLACSETAGDVRISAALAAIAVPGGSS